MPVIRDIPIELTAEEVIPSQGKRRLRPQLIQQAQEAIALGKTLWQPTAIYDWFDVRPVDNEHVSMSHPTQLGTETVLHIGAKANLLDNATEALVAVGTIGAALEEHVHQLQEGRDNLKSYLLDSAGVAALGAVGESLRCLVEETATERGWGVSAAISPGSLVGWPLREQKKVCTLLPLEEIDVHLNTSNVLEPHKSFSAVIGIGPDYETTQVGSVCKYCALQKTCWRRREDLS